jgi:hypothetical protein
VTLEGSLLIRYVAVSKAESQRVKGTLAVARRVSSVSTICRFSFLRIPFDDGYVDSLNDRTLPMHLEMFEGDEIRHHCHFGLKGFWYQNKFQQDV